MLVSIIVWFSLHFQQRVESVQKRFTKRLPRMSHLKYTARQTSLSLETLELRRWHHDLVLTYKILFGKLDTDCMNMFTVRSQSITRGHQWKLFAIHCRVDARKHFFCERVVAVWNSLPILADNLESTPCFRKKTPTHIIGYKLRNSCLILIIFDTKIPQIIWHRTTA